MIKRTIVALLAAALATPALACSKPSTSSGAPSHSQEDLKRLTVDQVEAKILAHDGKTFVFDNNDKERYAQGHVPGATWVDFRGVTPATLPPEKSATLIFYCANET